MGTRLTVHPAGDVTFAGVLVASPAWGAWLADVNLLLTTATLAVGLVLGVARLWSMWRGRRRKPDG